MNRSLMTSLLSAGLGAALVAALAPAAPAGDWLQFRGNDQRNVAADAALPVEWNKNHIAWKAELPGKAASGPIVAKGRVIVTSASGYRHDRLHVAAFAVNDGRKLWHRQFWATGRTQTNEFSSVAANTPASDGQRIYAFFSSNDLVCLDLDGGLIWYRGITHDYPTAANDVGMSSSPVVVDDAVVVQVENEVNSMAMGIDKRTGAELWHVDRPKRMNWSSPGVLRGAEQTLVLLQNGEYLSAHHPQTGEQAWRYEKGCSTIVSPVAVGDNVFVRSGSGTVKLLRKGTTPELEVAWDQPKLSSESASPVLHEGRIYTVNRAGVATCAREDTGAVVWQLRLKGPFWASPVLVGGKLYCFNHEGVCQVVELGDDAGKVVAQNELGDKVLGSPAVADDAMYVRSEGAVWKIAQP